MFTVNLNTFGGHAFIIYIIHFSVLFMKNRSIVIFTNGICSITGLGWDARRYLQRQNEFLKPTTSADIISEFDICHC